MYLLGGNMKNRKRVRHIRASPSIRFSHNLLFPNIIYK